MKVLILALFALFIVGCTGEVNTGANSEQVSSEKIEFKIRSDEKKPDIKRVVEVDLRERITEQQIKDIAKDCGYNLVLHGSMNRDLDLIAIPWIDNPKPELELVHRIDCIINEIPRNAEHNYQFSVLPGGRNSYVINICRGGEWNKYQDANFYLDISFTPQVSEWKNKNFV